MNLPRVQWVFFPEFKKHEERVISLHLCKTKCVHYQDYFATADYTIKKKKEGCIHTLWAILTTYWANWGWQVQHTLDQEIISSFSSVYSSTASSLHLSTHDTTKPSDTKISHFKKKQTDQPKYRTQNRRKMERTTRSNLVLDSKYGLVVRNSCKSVLRKLSQHQKQTKTGELNISHYFWCDLFQSSVWLKKNSPKKVALQVWVSKWWMHLNTHRQVRRNISISCIGRLNENCLLLSSATVYKMSALEAP